MELSGYPTRYKKPSVQEPAGSVFETNASQEILEPRIGAERIETWSQEDARIKSLFIAFFEPSHRLIPIPKSCGITEGVTDLIDALVEPVVEIDKHVGRPEFLLQLFAGHNFAGCSSSIARTWKGCSWSRTCRPCLRSSPARRSTSKTPKRSRPEN